MKEDLKKLDREIEFRKAQLTDLEMLVAKANQGISIARELFQRDYAKEIHTYKVKLAEVNAADDMLRRMTSMMKETTDKLHQERRAVAVHQEHLAVREKQLDDNLSKTSAVWSSQEANLANDKITLSKEREEFEAQRQTIIADLAVLAASRADTTILLQQLDKERKLLDNEKVALAENQEKLKQDIFLLKAKSEDAQRRLDDQARELKEKATTLEHKDLELQARALELAKSDRLDQLKKQVKVK